MNQTRSRHSNWLCILIVICLTFCGCREQLIHDLNEHDANRILTKLTENSIEAVKQRQPDGNWSIAVENSDSSRALTILAENRTLKSAKPNRGDSSGLISNKEEQRFSLEQRIGDELEDTLASVSGILESRVHLNLPRQDPVFGGKLGDKEEGSASVLIVVDGDAEVSREAIVSLVAGASGVSRNKISVIVNRTTGTPDEEMPARTVAKIQIDTVAPADNVKQLVPEEYSDKSNISQSIKFLLGDSPISWIASGSIICGFFVVRMIVRRRRVRRLILDFEAETV